MVHGKNPEITQFSKVAISEALIAEKIINSDEIEEAIITLEGLKILNSGSEKGHYSFVL
tara:strand:+ start:95 stop:271 length:177 start_codon:yes stop_codon:yes gene_type:complete